MDTTDKVYVVLPISHIVGISLLIMTLMSGGTVRLASKYDPAALARKGLPDWLIRPIWQTFSTGHIKVSIALAVVFILKHVLAGQKPQAV